MKANPAGVRRRRGAVALALAAMACVAMLPGAAPGDPRPGSPGAAAALAPAEAVRRMAELRAELARQDALYFQEAAPGISDYAYDQLRRELDGLEAAHPGAARTAAGPAPIGDDRTGRLPTWRHRVRMLGLDKTYDEAELRTFLAGVAGRVGRDGVAWVVEPKVDGVAVSAIYEHGRFVRAVTRGNGLEGDDITAQARMLRSLPRDLRPTAPGGSPNPIPDLIELRGELYVTFAEFARVNREREAADEPCFAHPRNLAAGAVRRSGPWAEAGPRLEVIFYGWGACAPGWCAPHSQHGFRDQARAWGLPVLPVVWPAGTPEEVVEAVRTCERRRAGLGFPIDGAVVKLDPVAARGRVGESERAPRWALAFKFAPERARTRLRGVTVQVGRTGLLTPVAELEPVALAGSLVTRATLGNRQAIARLDLRVGDQVEVERAGGVIPAIAAVVPAPRPADRRPYVFPAACPACGAAVVQLAGEAAMRCPNSACPAQVRQRLRHFASPGCAGIAGLGPVTIDALVASGRVRTVADLYRLRREDLAAVGRGRTRSADRLLAAIARSKDVDFGRLLFGLGIPRIGAVTARGLARRFGDLGALAAAGREEITAVAGPAAAGAVTTFFQVPGNRALVAELAALDVGHPATAGGRATEVRPRAIDQPGPARN